MGFICSTNDRDFAASRIRDEWARLSSSLRTEFGQEFELLLAKPLPHDGVTDWYIDLDAQPVRLSALAATERASVTERLDGMRRQVLAFADRLAAPNSRIRNAGLAEELRAVIRVPRDDDGQFVWSVYGHPVLVAWGLESPHRHEAEGSAFDWANVQQKNRPGQSHEQPVFPQAAPSPNISGQVAAAPSVVPKKRSFGPIPSALPLWLLFFGLVGASYFLLLQACAFSSTGAGSWLSRILPDTCRANSFSAELIAERDRRDFLVSRIRQAEVDAVRFEALCSSPGKQTQRQGAKQACQEVQNRLRENQAQAGAMEITLQWNGQEDLDLIVDCPGGIARAGFDGACESVGDIDWNYRKITERPIEHIVWKSDPPSGRYEIQVKYFDPKGPDHPVQFDVFVKRSGLVEGPFKGVVQKSKEVVTPHSFKVGPGQTPPLPTPQCDG